MIGAGWWRQIAWAEQQGIPKALGMDTRDWAQTFVGGWARLSVEDRREAVKELTTPKEDGGMAMSQRKVAKVLGVTDRTVRRDVAAANAAPEPEAERGGAADAAPEPEPEDEPEERPAPARRPPPTEAEQVAHLRRVWATQMAALAHVLTQDPAK